MEIDLVHSIYSSDNIGGTEHSADESAQEAGLNNVTWKYITHFICRHFFCFSEHNNQLRNTSKLSRLTRVDFPRCYVRTISNMDRVRL